MNRIELTDEQVVSLRNHLSKSAIALEDIICSDALNVAAVFRKIDDLYEEICGPDEEEEEHCRLFISDATLARREEAMNICKKVGGILCYCSESGNWVVRVEYAHPYVVLAELGEHSWDITLYNEEENYAVAEMQGVLDFQVPVFFDILGNTYDPEYKGKGFDDGEAPGCFDNCGHKFTGKFFHPGKPVNPPKRLVNLHKLLGVGYKLASNNGRDCIYKEVASSCAVEITLVEGKPCLEFWQEFGESSSRIYFSEVPVESIPYLVERVGYCRYPNGCVM